MDVLSIYLLTWNVVTMEPPKADQLKSLLESKADLIVIGLQEVKSQPQNLISDSLYEDSWTNSFRDILAKEDFIKIHSIRLVGILLSVFSKKAHLVSIRNIETSYTRTGLRGFWGNKGAVTVRFNFKGNSFCFVNSHLSPHDNMIQSRISDYATIVSSQTFHKEKIGTILDHDLVFWIGDLNFRLDEPATYTAKDIVDQVTQNKLPLLLDKDELKLVIQKREAFSDFSECEINFKPTYKFVPGTQEYDKKRRPAWTDRIIFRSFNATIKKEANSGVTCKSYTSHPNLTMSDHKPVSAYLSVKIKGGDLETVSFEPIDSWVVGAEGRIIYTLPESIQPNSWHWIALFRETFSSLGEYITYLWSSRQPLPGRVRSFELTIPEDSLRVPGRYFAAYMSEAQPYHVMGISPTFEVKEAPEKRKEL